MAALRRVAQIRLKDYAADRTGVKGIYRPIALFFNPLPACSCCSLFVSS